MKKRYTEPEMELVKFRLDTLMSDLTLHSQTEHGGSGGALGDDDGDNIEFP